MPGEATPRYTAWIVAQDRPPGCTTEENTVSQMSLPRVEPPGARHRAEHELPFVTFFEGFDFQLLQANVENGL